MGRIVHYNETPLTIVVTELIKRQKPTPGSNKTEAARYEAQHRGWVEGMCEALAAYGTSLRVQAYAQVRAADPNERWVSAVDSYPVVLWIKHQLTEWNEGVWKEESDENYFAVLTQRWLDEVVFPKDIAEDIENRRRKLVLSGDILPKPEDAAWIQEERRAFAELVAPYDQVLQRLREEKSE